MQVLSCAGLGSEPTTTPSYHGAIVTRRLASSCPPRSGPGPGAGPTSGAEQANGRFPTFEGLRALCALGVLAFHAGSFSGLTSGASSSSAIGSWVRHLNVGVAIFFVLSGFLLFRPFVLAHLGDQPPPRRRTYAWRRLVRIFPAYWLALTVSVWVLHLELGDWWGHLRFFGLLQIYAGDTVLGGLVQAWSLCTELSFYLFLPIWAAALARVGGSVDRRVRAHYLGCALLYLGGLGFRAELRAGDHAIGYAWLPANTDLFALGMGLAVASAAASVRRRAPGGLGRTVGELPAVAWLAALCCYGGVVALRYPFGFSPPTVTQEVGRQVLFGAVAALVVAPGVFGNQDEGVVRRALRWRPLWAVGVVSYGVYLWHLTIMEKLVPSLRPPGPAGPGGPPGLPSWWAVAGGTTAATVVVAAASWFALERPLLVWVRRRRAPDRASPRVRNP